MSDKPFKMQGHTLPGPSQRSALKLGVGTSKAQEAMLLRGLNTGIKRNEGTPVGEGYEGGEDYTAIQEAQNTQPYVDTGADDAFAGDDTKKKKVDVEVTVNGEPV